MSRLTYSIVAAVLVATCLGVVAHAQQTTAPPFATTKVDGTDNVYIFRNGNHQAMFVVTSAASVGSVPGRGMIASYPVEWEDSLTKVLAMDWDKLIPGHPAAPGGRLGTKQDVQNLRTFLQDAPAAVKAEAQADKCWDGVEKELKLPTYESWAGYESGLPFVLRRDCGLWSRGT